MQDPHGADITPALRALRSNGAQEALPICDALLRSHPQDPMLLALHGSLLVRVNESEAAEQALRRAIAIAPDLARPRETLGKLLLGAHRDAEALQELQYALSLRPNRRSIRFALGQALSSVAQHEEALELYQALALEFPDSAHAWFRLAGALGKVGHNREAARAYQRCLAIKSDHAGAQLGLGHMCKALGRQAEAVQAYRACVRLRPRSAKGWFSLANLKTYTFTGAEQSAMLEQLEQDSLAATDETGLCFALANASENQGDYDTAWAFFERGNACQRQRIAYSAAANRRRVDALISTYTPTHFQAHAGAGEPDRAPVFIVGLPRSGSSLVEQILASHSQVEGTGELPYIGLLARNHEFGPQAPSAAKFARPAHASLAELGRRYLAQTRIHRTQAARHFIDKMPNNFMQLGFIHSILPGARLIDVRRNPMDTCVSNLRQLYARGQPFAYDQTEVGLHYLQYLRIMEHWNKALPIPVLRIQYETLVSDPEAQVQRLLDFLELDWESHCLRFHETPRAVRTASAQQVRQPLYEHSIGAWRRYEEHLGELLAVLAHG